MHSDFLYPVGDPSPSSWPLGSTYKRDGKVTKTVSYSNGLSCGRNEVPYQRVATVTPLVNYALSEKWTPQNNDEVSILYMCWAKHSEKHHWYKEGCFALGILQRLTGIGLFQLCLCRAFLVVEKKNQEKKELKYSVEYRKLDECL